MRSLLRLLLDQLPYVGTLRKSRRAIGEFPAGHFHSPIPDASEIQARLRAPNRDLLGVSLRTEEQRALLNAFGRFYADIPFAEDRTPGIRYYFNQTVFCYADAVFLYSFLRLFQPRRIIEIGSGFSSAVMLDTADRFLPHSPEITLVDPYTDRLEELLRDDDWNRVTLIEDWVQRVPIERFTALQAGDLLFIDSSHVLKCGSDLQFLLFDVLPRLSTGVFVHFHDVFSGFEYPAEWLLRGWYWNEDYMLRAFLMHNSAWEIVLFGNYAVQAYGDWFAQHMPLCLKNPGGSLYLRRTAV